MKYAKGSLKLSSSHKEGGWIIIIKATGERVPGTPEYPLDKEAQGYAEIRKLERGD